MSRTLNVVRMQLINRQTYIWVPLLVLGGSLVITLAIYGIIANAGVDTAMYGGGAQAPLWYFAVVGAQALTLTFPFSQAMSVTRREFYLGTLLTAALTSAMLAVIFVIGGLVEKATNGWGMNGYFFALDWLWEQGPIVAGFFFFTLAMLFFVIGFAGATLYKRFGTMWLTIVILGIAVLFVAALWLIGQADAWVEVFGWFARLGSGGLALFMAGVAAVLAVVSFPVLRRAVP
ncbi:hypothetical protein [Microbacterium caowuchunii]|uniref:Uncharacterized protein n=1 Tax=Microbacterium caowuchunii TaxID=2614638 RepID=A0A5N0TIV8_9MICO|nr:hypothetical protein [Microbacterium caowuchunii]KAA9134541.1 hypothetical protein F6B40_07225 [Microbacterium caowuchunii]